jgi:hypothetical protein
MPVAPVQWYRVASTRFHPGWVYAKDMKNKRIGHLKDPNKETTCLPPPPIMTEAVGGLNTAWAAIGPSLLLRIWLLAGLTSYLVVAQKINPLSR